MKRIEIRGIIVPSMYDQSFMEEYIAKGMITPESRIRQQLAEVEDDVELYINSQGGSVFSGNELINAFREFRASGKSLVITVGAMAASMAANLIATVGADKVRAHRNAKIMFHGATANTWAGAESHKDSAELLDSVNNDVIAALMSLPKADKNQIQGWFAEGREGWLSAQQAFDMGLVTEIITADASPIASIQKDEAAKLLEGGIDIAAFSLEPPAALPKTPEGFVAQAEFDALAARLTGLQSAKDKEIMALKTEHAAKMKDKDDASAALAQTVKDLDAKIAAITSDLGKATASLSAEVAGHATTKAALATSSEQLAEAKAKHAALVGGVLGGSPDGQSKSGDTGLARMIAAEKADTEKKGA